MEVLITIKSQLGIIGTGLYFTYEGDFYVVTCSHVADEPATFEYGVIANPSKALWGSQEVEYVALKERLIHPSDTNILRHDIVVYQLASPLKTITPASLPQFESLSHRVKGHKLELRGYSTEYLRKMVNSLSDERILPERVECFATELNDIKQSLATGITEARFNIARVDTESKITGGHSGSPVYDSTSNFPIGIAFYSNPVVTNLEEYTAIFYVPIESVIELITHRNGHISIGI
ncbi:hypothetical protein KUC3_39810 [Alteromonas sp. KC3]|uniref:trypsin-like peptidase domain-containing protein n=1 Tax=unclassified Alteromonas TaxID=2614992 RepID=UPI0019249B88|nr:MULTISPECIES: trypsin-like peptidase domain-containing protein [unclassified Alteromonas]BCO21124.1 hypothetical protein KUC3_39810 [Alteromonas sp. KC3]BCO25089.1 hypothetical protein KUC14_39580 [Alteromonas sp. KC14]